MNRTETVRRVAGETGLDAASSDAAVKAVLAVPASRSVSFRAAKALKDAVNGARGE